jgi:hypothetical protein
MHSPSIAWHEDFQRRGRPGASSLNIRAAKELSLLEFTPGPPARRNQWQSCRI